MDWGMRNRLARIINPQDGRALMLAVDHGYFLGPTEKLEEPDRAIAPLLKYCDSLMLTRGVQRACVPPSTSTPMVLRVSGGPSVIGADLSRERITVSMEEALRLNASAVAMSVFVGSKYEHKTVASLGHLVDEAQRYGMPVLAVTAVGKEMGRDARYLSLACRMAAEQGANVVKTYYCEGFERVVSSCPVPIIVAGGKKIPEREALELTYNSVRLGAVGVDMGRNIWQSDHPVPMIRAVRSIVHGNSDAERAYGLYKKLVEDGPRGKRQAPRPAQAAQPAQQPSQRPPPQPAQQPAQPPKTPPPGAP
ncbi:MAG: 3-hydroxy-5-phosphonooxypentane-2,4-dione thiolase [Nitrosopumilus sp.]|nr:3-hydroxy-5-phosphonooxypentane-2,4-dione thiolase [Nitrosopumilus sp.]